MILGLDEAQKRERNRLATARYRARHPERVALAKKKWKDSYAGSPEQKLYSQNWWRMRHYNISPEQWAEMSKDGCEVCKSFVRLCVDHDHKTGKIRGVLCHSCNASIGHFRDNPVLLRKAALYLEEKCLGIGN